MCFCTSKYVSVRNCFPFENNLKKHLQTIAKLPETKRLWQARKLYAGSLGQKTGAVLPPTDPRLANLTDEQIELDVLLFLDDNPELKKKAEVYQDSDYEEAMKADLAEPVEPDAPPPPQPVTPAPNDLEEVPFDDE